MSLDSGFRATGTVHDVDSHGLAVDFFTDGRTPDLYLTAWSPHVFRDSFREHPHPEVVLDHKTGSANVIGRTVRAESLSDRARLVGAFDDFSVKPNAERAYRGILDGTYPGFSFWFTRAQHQPLEGVRGAKRYTRARLEDWGPVRRPAIKGQQLVGIRSESGVPDVQGALERLERRFGGLEYTRARMADVEVDDVGDVGANARWLMGRGIALTPADAGELADWVQEKINRMSRRHR